MHHARDTCKIITCAYGEGVRKQKQKVSEDFLKGQRLVAIRCVGMSEEKLHLLLLRNCVFFFFFVFLLYMT